MTWNWLFYALMWGLGFAAGFAFASSRHHKFMAMGWYYLGTVAETRTPTQYDVMKAFGGEL